MSEPLVLLAGDRNLSSWSLRAWLVLRQSGLPFEERVFRFEEDRWRERVAEVSPSRTVPVLRHGELVVWDSLAIAEYVAELAPEAGLWPEDRAARAVARAAAAEMHSGFGRLRRERPMDIVARHGPTPASPELEREIERVQEIWRSCRERFGAGGPFLFGRFSIADAMFAPVVYRFRSYDVPVRPEVRAFHDAMLALPAMQEWERGAEEEVRARAARGPEVPSASSGLEYWAVLFTSQLAGTAPEGYEATAAEMVELARQQPGFLGIESVRGADGAGITISYWSTLEAIARFRAEERHRMAQREGRERFYARYEIRIASVERGYKFP